ncbi:MAG: metal ABC transporter substrate-binding protein [Clostridiales bacterium]|nr:metal ABC transporter substrate-binding protein [Clostridiales bacterium]
MKKIIIILMTLMLLCLGLAGCGGQSQPEEEATANDEAPIKIVTTIFPEYDWVRAILGDNPSGMDLKVLADKGTDLHSYQPTAEDIMDMSTCDVLIYVGGESDGYIDDALRTRVNENQIELNLLEVLGESAKEEESKEGMEAEEGEEEGEEEEGPEYDEHIWLSLRNASALCDSICDALSKVDPANEDYYRSNLEAYKEKLAELDGEYEDVIGKAENKTLVFGDRYPFRYMFDDYGLDYFAAFSGCSAETEASFETVTFLAKKVDELGLDCVMTIEKSDGKIAHAIIDNTESKDQKIIELNSLQSVVGDDIENGMTYLDIMTENLNVLKEALGE